MPEITFRSWISDEDTEYEVDVKADCTPGSPAVMYLKNGDPGYPAEPAEVEITSVVIMGGLCDGAEVVKNLSDAHIAKLTEKALEEAGKADSGREEDYDDER